jgi:hypothetical protein
MAKYILMLMVGWKPLWKKIMRLGILSKDNIKFNLKENGHEDVIVQNSDEWTVIL